MSEVGVVHTTGAMVALLAGAAVLLGRKGTRVHRQLGHLYLWALVLVNGTAFMLTELTGRFGPFHVLAGVSLATLCAGVVPALTRRPKGGWLELHARYMAWSYAGLSAAAAAEVAVRIPGAPFGVAAAVASVVVVSGSAVLIHGRREALLRGAMRKARAPSPRSAGAVLLLLGVTSVGGSGPVAAQEPQDSTTPLSHALLGQLDEAVLRGDLAALRGVRRELKGLPAEDPLVLHYVGYARYREAELLPDTSSEERAALRQGARRALEASAEGVTLGETHALLAQLIGVEMGGSVLRAIWLGGRWERERRAAKAVAPANPRVLLLAGILAYHAPPNHGGGLERAEAELRAAVEAFRADTARRPHPTWGRAEAHFWLGRVWERQGRVEDARSAYQRALELEPEYGWARLRLEALRH